MAKIDTRGWKEFIIGDLFEKLQLDIKKEDFNKTFDVSEERTEEFNLPLVNAKHGNNGIMYYGREADFETAGMTIDIVQNGAIATGDVYAQPQRTGVLWDAYLVKPKAKIDSAFTLMFLATVLEKAIKDKFSYDDKCVWDKAKLLTVTLPCTREGEPDWAYMDEYMSAVMRESEASLESLRQADESKHALDIAEWQEFVIGNLFEPLESGFVGEGRKIGTATTSPDKEHTIPLTAAKNDNNGIMYWGRPGDYITYSNVIAVIRDGAVSTGRVFAQKNETGTYSHSYFIRVKGHTVSFLTNLFLSRVLEAVIYPRYTRDDACIWERIVNDTILLPADTSGEPDWVYMDEYMRTIMENAASDLSAMQSIG